MPTVLDWNPTVDPSEFVRHLRETLAAGATAVLPGDCGYVVLVNPNAPTAAAQLEVLASAGLPAVLAFGPDDPPRLGLEVPVAARRLMFRAWPDALVVALPAEQAVLPGEWLPAARERVVADRWVRFRSPDHPVFDGVFPALDAPVLIADTFLPTAEAVIDSLEDHVGLAVSVGPRPTEPRPTVVTADAVGYAVAEVGAVPADEVQKLAARIILFVCTGNTCRSPLAEGLAKKLLSQRLGCRVEDLPARGLWVLSAGTAAYGGGPAAVEAEEVAAEFGADLRDHRSRPLNPQLLAAADDVIVMTAAHAHALEARFPELGPAVRLLGGDEGDLDDPIGAGRDVYRACATTIEKHLGRFLPEWTGT
jgi:protein-tyrosine phosphatase